MAEEHDDQAGKNERKKCKSKRERASAAAAALAAAVCSAARQASEQRVGLLLEGGALRIQGAGGRANVRDGVGAAADMRPEEMRQAAGSEHLRTRESAAAGKCTLSGQGGPPPMFLLFYALLCSWRLDPQRQILFSTASVFTAAAHGFFTTTTTAEALLLLISSPLPPPPESVLSLSPTFHPLPSSSRSSPPSSPPSPLLDPPSADVVRRW